jgi:hypothetical protein
MPVAIAKSDVVNFAMAETWLPQEPPPPEPPNSSLRRTVFIWLGLVAFFVIIYGCVTRLPHPATTSGHDAGSLPSWIWLACAGCFALPMAIRLWWLGDARRFYAQQAPAFEAVGDGQYARAAQLFGDKDSIRPAANG